MGPKRPFQNLYVKYYPFPPVSLRPPIKENAEILPKVLNS